MRYRLLGRSGLRVSELCLGTMTFGEDWGFGAPKETCRAIVEAFAEAGGNFVDTSVNYTDGSSETILGEVIAAEREHFVVATKYTLTDVNQADPNQGGNSRKNMRQSVERSLKRLRTDYLDVLYLHAWDFTTPVDEVMRGLDDLVRAGKVLYVAVSDTPAWIVAEANARAELLGWSRFVGLQVPYALTQRGVERAELPMARHWDMAVLAWGVLGGGLLTGKYASTGAADGPRRHGDRVLTEAEARLVETLSAVAAEVGRSASQVALNWVRGQAARAQIIPILGVRSTAQLADNLACLDWSLSAEQLARLDEVSRIEYGFPRDFVERSARPFIFGQTFERIDNHRGYPAW